MLAHLSRRTGFQVRDIYRVKRPSFISAARQKLSFFIAILSLVAFVAGNMVGQHGWYAFWKTVMGKEEVIVFAGMVPPIAFVPDYERWAGFGGDVRLHVYRQVPTQYLVPLPRYDERALRDGTADAFTSRVYSVGHMGDYATGRDGAGSHVGIDIAVPVGTPVVSIANGIVEKVATQVSGYGLYVMIRHPGVPQDGHADSLRTIWSIYAHLDAALVREGQVVSKGQQIAYSGQSGFASGPHLHFQIDNDQAPFHPYWPFTGEEQRSAGYSFTQAIDRGLHQERGTLFTESPMLLVQRQGSVAAVALRSSAASSARRVTTVAERRQSRISARTSVAHIQQQSSATSSSVSVAVATTDVSSGPLPTSSVETVVQLHSAPSPVPVVGSTTDVASVRFQHSGNMQRAWQRVEIQALDRFGNLVKTPVFPGTIYLLSSFGSAEFRPSTLTSRDFENGIATVQVLSRGAKTVILSARGAFTADSSPLIYDR